MLDIQMVLSLLLLGSIVGFIAGLLGVGGGAIMVPVLTTLFLMHNIPNEQVIHLALGSSMASIIITSLSSLRAQHKKMQLFGRWLNPCPLVLSLAHFSQLSSHPM